MVNSFLDFWASSTQHGIRWKTAFLSEQIAEIFSSLYYKLNSFSFLSIKRNNEHNFFFFIKAALAVENTFCKKKWIGRKAAGYVLKDDFGLSIKIKG